MAQEVQVEVEVDHLIQIDRQVDRHVQDDLEVIVVVQLIHDAREVIDQMEVVEVVDQEVDREAEVAVVVVAQLQVLVQIKTQL